MYRYACRRAQAEPISRRARQGLRGASAPAGPACPFQIREVRGRSTASACFSIVRCRSSHQAESAPKGSASRTTFPARDLTY